MVIAVDISDKDGDASGPVRVVRVLQNFVSTRVGSWCHSDIHCLNVRRVKPWNGRYRLAAGVSPFWATISIISDKDVDASGPVRVIRVLQNFVSTRVGS